MEQRPRDAGDGDTLEHLALAAAYRRLAGDAAAADGWLRRVAAFADPARGRQDDQVREAAEVLFLNARPDLALDVLVGNRQYEAAFDFTRARLMFDEATDVAERARRAAGAGGAAPRVEAKAAALLAVLGDAKGAAARLRRAEAAAGRPRTVDVSVALVRAAAETGDAAVGAAGLGASLEATGAENVHNAAALFAAAGAPGGRRAARWWDFLRRRGGEPAQVVLPRLRALLDGALPAGDVERIAREAEQDVGRHPPADEQAWIGAIADALVAVGRRDAAREVLRRGGEAGAADLLVRAGDLDAEDGRDDAAAERYGRAWEMDRAQPVPALLKGHALIRLGREREGRALVELAHLLPLGDETKRHALAEAAAARKLTADVARERDLAARTGAFASWHLSDLLRRAGDDANATGDYARAADLWERAFLDNLGTATRFVEPTANLSMPALLLRTRALARIKAGDASGGAALAEAGLAISPGDTDALIDVVAALDAAGDRARADALYAKTTAHYRALCAKHPASGSLHNQLAWAAAKCGRDLDDALTHGARAVELEPDDTASLDTLAEVHFRRGEMDKAIETINRCIALEPKNKHHREQLARFQAARAGEKAK